MEEHNLLEILASNVRSLRQARSLSQEQLAAECGLHRTYVGAVERAERNITLGSLAKIAMALGENPASLIQLRNRSDE